MALPSTLICPVCEEAGEKSTVNVLGGARTDEPVRQFYAEDGELRIEDPNVTETFFRCSRGHEFKAVAKHGEGLRIEASDANSDASEAERG